LSFTAVSVFARAPTLRHHLRLPLDYEEGEFASFKLADGSKAENFGPSDAEHTHFSTGPYGSHLILLLEYTERACAGDGLELRVGSERPQDRADVVARRLVRDV
jgi:hypothetical protein